MRSRLEQCAPVVEWLRVEKCPACGSRDCAMLDKLPIREYRFGDERILLPEGGVGLVECSSCDLVFKDVLPSPESLAEVFTRQAGKVWAGNYNFSDEARLIYNWMNGRVFDVLDIGASNGGLLKALSDGEGRRSALDVVQHPGLEAWLRGEFISGLAESADLRWSKETYDVVTLLDVAEHLYDPNQAFVNLEHFVEPGGLVVVETGDVRSFWPQTFGIGRWWYACLFEHHLFWSRDSFESLARQHGFDAVHFEKKSHKESGTQSLWSTLATGVKSRLYRLAPGAYHKLSLAVGKSGVQARDPLAQDHFRVILRKRV